MEVRSNNREWRRDTCLHGGDHEHRLAVVFETMGTPSNKKMQQTRHGQTEASLLIFVFGRRSDWRTYAAGAET
jgi:hypothetical protein